MLDLNGLNDLKTGVRFYRVIQGTGFLQPLEMRTELYKYPGSGGAISSIGSRNDVG
jgi:hypothetical protein